MNGTAHAREIVKKACLSCGGEILTTPFRLATGRGKYCSKPCHYKSKIKPIEPRRAAKAEYQRQHYQASLEENRARRRAWRAAHPDYNRRYYEANAERLKVAAVEYVRRRPDVHAQASQRRRALKAAAIICDLTRQQWDVIKAAFGHRCAYCGIKPRRLTQDHIIPLSKGGNHTASNIVPACKSCNSKKHDGPPMVPVQPVLVV